MRTAASLLVLGALTAVAAFALDLVGLSSATLFAALLVGLTAALWRPTGEITFPRWTFVAAQAVLGVTLGAYLEPDALEAVGGAWLPVALVSAGTLFVSMGAGLILARRTELNRATATLGMIAGGASGIVGMAGELGGDDRLVAFMQYMRVLVVVLLTPLLVLAWGGGGGGEAPSEAVLATGHDWLLTALIAPGGALVARRLNVPAGTLMGPMVARGRPHPRRRRLRRAARRARARVRADRTAGRPALHDRHRAADGPAARPGAARRRRPAGRPASGSPCVLHLLTDLSLRDAYLATTPGGIYAVLAIAFGTGGNMTFIVARPERARPRRRAARPARGAPPRADG